MASNGVDSRSTAAPHTPIETRITRSAMRPLLVLFHCLSLVAAPRPRRGERVAADREGLQNADKGCVDQHRHCTRWAREGNCEEQR